MRAAVFALVGGLSLAACTQGEPHPYPQAAQTRFEASCPRENPVCACTWDNITRALPYDDYEGALARFEETGNMDPRITRARTRCIERQRRES